MSSTTTNSVYEKVHQATTAYEESNAVQVASASITWNVTNASGTNIVIIRYASEEDSTTDQVYERSLTQLETTDGQKWIKAGSAATINLEAEDHNIILARADDLYPVKMVDLVVDEATQTFPAQTVTTGDAANMKLAERLKKYVAAFPNSVMAKDFKTVLSGNDPAKATSFFKRYEAYKSLTIDMVVAVETYYNVYPFAWAGYAKAKTYRLYTSNGKANKKLGTVTLSNACSVPVNTDKAAPGFTITYTNGSTLKKLAYANGQFVDDVSSAKPAICLQGLFTLKSGLTSISTDNEVIPILGGTINSESVMGYDEGKAKNASTLDRILNPQTLLDWLEFCGIILGGIIVIGLLTKLLKMTYDAIQKPGPDPAQEQWDKINDEFLRAQKELMKTDQRYLDRLAAIEAPRLPENFADFSALVENRSVKISYEADMQNVTDIWTKQNEMCKTALEYGNKGELGKVNNTLKEVKDWLNTNPDVASVAGKLNDTMTKFEINSELLNKEWAGIKKKKSEDMIAMDKAQREMADITNKVKENEKIREDVKDEKIPDDIIED